MRLRPANLAELQAALAQAHARSEKIVSVDLSAFNRVLEHTPEDMTATVEAGLTLAELQAVLAHRGQWLPVDPPQPERLTMGELLSSNAQGPRRLGYGAIRDYLIGIRVVLADGRAIKAGGKVVKNVAGYDLGKLFVGSGGSLGVIVEATFKLRPRPETEQFVEVSVDSLDHAGALLEQIAASALSPIVLDLHNVPAPNSALETGLTVVLGFAGAREDVEFQLAKARELGAVQTSSLDYDKAFWIREATEAVRRMSVLPSEVTRTLSALGSVCFVARAGHGTIYYRGGPESPKADLPTRLLRRVKEAYDPKNILPDFPL